MSIESLGLDSQNVPESKSSRLEKILALLNQQPPASNANEACSMLQECFLEIEAFKWEDRMILLPLRGMPILKVGTKEIYYVKYKKHMLILGENGAIEIRKVDPSVYIDEYLLAKDPFLPQIKMELFYLKVGADGKGPWE